MPGNKWSKESSNNTYFHTHTLNFIIIFRWPVTTLFNWSLLLSQILSHYPVNAFIVLITIWFHLMHSVVDIFIAYLFTSLFETLLHSQPLEQYLTQKRHLTSICWMKNANDIRLPNKIPSQILGSLILSQQEYICLNKKSSAIHLLLLSLSEDMLKVLEREEGKRSNDVREKNTIPAPTWGQTLKPRYMPWPGIKPATLHCTGWHSNELVYTSQGSVTNFAKWSEVNHTT